MIHEILCCLYNCSNEFDTESEENWLGFLKLQEFLHPSEKELLERILTIGRNYHIIQAFIETVNNEEVVTYETDSDASGERKTAQAGLYVKAFCKGVDDVLEDYRKEIINLEEMILKNLQLTLTFILGAVEKYVTLFEALRSMIKMIKRKQIHGCILIGKLHMYRTSSVEIVAKSTEKIVQAINKIFYRHLCNWIINGDLVDMHKEFFICDANCADENFLYPDQIGNANQLTNMDSVLESFKTRKIRKSYLVRKFYIKPDMIPEFVTTEMAETILFLGRIVWIVQNKPQNRFGDKSELITKKDVWEGKDDEYYRKLESLASRTFNLAEFNKAIEECQLKITKYLRKVLVEDARLLDHLQLIRDYYALGRGELFQQFIVVVENQSKEYTKNYIINDLNFIFTETAKKLYGEHDKTYLHFELMLPQDQEQKIDDTILWSHLELNFDMNWPLHILFHPQAIGLYNKLFCFLLRVKKTHIDLHKLWHEHIYGKRKIDSRVWSLRNNLMHIVNNLQYYLQVDVIEANFSILKNSLESSNEFEDIIRLHSKFLRDLLNETFLMTAEHATQEAKHTLYQTPQLKKGTSGLVYTTIIEILQFCDKFCAVASKWDDQLNDLQQEELERLKNQSDALVETLLNVLYSLHLTATGHHLLQLLRHIDFNRWFSKNNANLNLTVSNSM